MGWSLRVVTSTIAKIDDVTGTAFCIQLGKTPSSRLFQVSCFAAMPCISPGGFLL
jgi:hypothetical protein